jgi:hypothetical protein
MSNFIVSYTYDHPDGTKGIKGSFNQNFKLYDTAETFCEMNRESNGFVRYDFIIREVK